MDNNNPLGMHYILDFYDCNSKYLTSVLYIRKIMQLCSQVGKFKVVKSCFHQFKPHGVSGVMVLKESHFSIHTWPEYKYAAVDIFLCDTKVSVDRVVEYLCSKLETKNCKILVLKRGVELSNSNVIMQ